MPPESGLNEKIFVRRIHPHRSLDAKNFRVLMWVVAGASLAVSVPFFILGAWPVAGFMGLDVLLVYLAFRASFRSARAYEDIDVTLHELHIAKVTAQGKRRDWHFNPQWVRLERQEHEEFGLQKLSLVSSGRKIGIAAFLGPEEKAEFAGQLQNALGEARRGPRYS